MTRVLPQIEVDDQDLDVVDEEDRVDEIDDLPAEAAAEAEDVLAVEGEAPPAEPTLTDRERSMLIFERQWWRHAGSKEQAIREQFELSATRYYQMLNQLLDRPEALAFDPLVVGRLRRLRATRARTRTAH